MDWDGFIKGWKELASTRGFSCETLLEREGMEILGCRKESEKADAPWIYLSSGVHGDEPSGPQALMRLLEEDYFGPELNWLICPVLNPTGLARATRETMDGKDINRDYKKRETPEVRAHLAWLDEQPTASLFISLHEDWESTGVYYYEINDGVDGVTYQEMMKAAEPFFPPEPQEIIDEHETRELGWIYHESKPDVEDGWPEAIYLALANCSLSYTIETPSSKGIEARISAHVAMSKAAVEGLGA